MTEKDLAVVVRGLTPVIREVVAGLEGRLKALEDRPPARDGRDGLPGVPGAPGEKGLDGTNGTNGEPGPAGKDGTAGLTYEGVYQDGQSYERGAVVTWGGSAWHCSEPTTTKPGEGSKAWTLIVKRGRDGRDGTVGPEGKPGRDGKDWKGQS